MITMPIKFKLGEADEAKYPSVGDGWYVYDAPKLRAMTNKELILLEEHLAGHAIIDLERAFLQRRMIGLFGVMYIARRLAGVNERWENFDPLVMEVLWETLGDLDAESADADPGTGEAGVGSGEGGSVRGEEPPDPTSGSSTAAG